MVSVNKHPFPFPPRTVNSRRGLRGPLRFERIPRRTLYPTTIIGALSRDPFDKTSRGWFPFGTIIRH